MIRVLYAGDTETVVLLVELGAVAVPSVERFFDGRDHLKKALLKDPEIEVELMSNKETFERFPQTVEQLREYDVVVLSDVPYDSLSLRPGDEIYKISPNRLTALKRFVEEGGGLCYCGGWLSYQGHFGQGRWYGTSISEIFPVEILPIPDDRIENSDGARPEIIDVNHPIMEGLDWTTCPAFLGYNRVGKVKDGAKLLGTINGDPFLIVWDVRKGRVVALTSDPAPHWGAWINWDHYSDFWIRVIKWVGKEL